ncbi:murein biosynthesis integral membrane protein MurJ [Trujillonella humicola]|uniref:murein biosynthesis integral membrane protein MurJ n=1 Tax=Trujillonella humicola TaxID=3383699 RepID=UPI003906D2B8
MSNERPVGERDRLPLPPVPPAAPRRAERDAEPPRSRPPATPLPPPPYPVVPDPADGTGMRPPVAPLRPVPPPAVRRDRAVRSDRPLPPVPPPRPRFVPGPDDTQLIPVLPAVPQRVDETDEEASAREGAPGASRGILRAAGTMAVATLVSRVTGLLRTMVLAAALGVGLVNDAYNTANTLPNIVYELLLGGVLTSVIVPLFVHAQERDRDGGVGYVQRLSTVAIAGLVVVTALAVLAAPLLTRLYGISGDPDQVRLANWLARLLLLEVVFYGVGALAQAVLNSRGVFGPPAWAPVLNNVVVIATGVVFMAVADGELTPGSISPGLVWLLGVGTTLGIAVQALILLPLLPRVGVPLRPRWGVRQTGLREAGSLGLWVVAYSAVSAIGVAVATRIANQAGREGGLGSSAFAIASLLFQMPYGIIGVALLTALVPRMSRAAARSDVAGVVSDLSLGTRLSALGLLPVTAALVVLGPPLATVAFARGNTSVEEAHAIGVALALGAFGLLPMAVTLLQLRVFYAMKDARTPTLIQVGMVAVRVPLLLAVPAVVGPEHVVAGLMLVTSITYVAGWVLGHVALTRRLGTLDTRSTLGPVLRVTAASLAAALLGSLVTIGSRSVLGTSVAGSLGTLLVGTVVIGVAAVGGMLLARVPEVTGPLSAVLARRGRR